MLKVSTENDKVSKCLVWIHMVFSILGPTFVELKHPIHYDRFWKILSKKYSTQMSVLGTNK